jgi:DNA processing protein
MTGTLACDGCLRRPWLLARLAGHLDLVRRRIEELLALGDQELVAAVGGTEREAIAVELEQLDPDLARTKASERGLEIVCRCSQAYPKRLHALANPPAVLHVAGGLERFSGLVGGDPVAIVGARGPTDYGCLVANSLGRALAGAGLTVISGMALGVDSAAHAGALGAPGPTIAVLPCGADRPYPPGKRALRRQIVKAGAAISELPPGTPARRWTFPARNRMIAALAAITVVVEARERSGALITARIARELERPVGAVPGRVNSELSSGPNTLLAGGAVVVRGAADVLDALFGAGAGARMLPEHATRPRPPPGLRALLAAVGDGASTHEAFARAEMTAADGLAGLAALELGGYVRREAGGRFSVIP